MADVSQHAPRCAGCAEISVPPSDPVDFLRRLPARLFNRARPIPGAEATFDDIILDVTQFGPIGGVEPTPQYEIARIVTLLKDGFRVDWRRAEALQLGLGRMGVGVDGETTCECPRAAGADLDQVGEQFGIGRPLGFSDCCYWRLILLLLFKPGSTRWLIRELAELYTGIRPGLIETPARLTLTFPISGGESFADARRASGPNAPGGWFAGQDAFADGDAPIAAGASFHAYALDGPHDNTAPAPVYPDSFIAPLDTVPLATGLTLAAALARVKAAGIFVDYFNLPPGGIAGCYGATLRGPAVGVYAA